MVFLLSLVRKGDPIELGKERERSVGSNTCPGLPFFFKQSIGDGRTLNGSVHP